MLTALLGLGSALLVAGVGLLPAAKPVTLAETHPNPAPATSDQGPDPKSPRPADPPPGRKNESPASAHELVLVPMGGPDAALIAFVADSLRRRFVFDVRVADNIDMPVEAWYAPRHRWRAEKILDALDRLDTGDAWRVAGLTEERISTTKGNVYDWGIAGLGTMSGKSCVLTARYFRRLKKKSPDQYHRFMENLVLHEVGHTLGLPHCPLERCIMADAKGNAIRAAKKSINEFCPRCHGLIRDHLRDKEVKGRWSMTERLILERAP